MTEIATPAAPSEPLAGWRATLRDLAQMIRFYSRIPVAKLPFEEDAHAIPDFATAARMLPVAALIIGAPGALTLWLAVLAGLPEHVAAALAVAVAVLVTGAFHEDGLADTFDGLGGGWTPERRLEIMKDSRIGSYGGAALVLSLILRATALAALADWVGGWQAGVLVLAAAPLSRTMGLVPVALLPPARTGGFSSAVGRPSAALLAGITALALGLGGCGIVLAEAPLWGGVLGAILAGTAAGVMTGWARRAIQGQTGDIAGAVQQLSEIAFYLGILIAIGHD